MHSFQRTGRRERLFIAAGRRTRGRSVDVADRDAAIALLRDLGRDPWGRIALRQLYAEAVGRAAACWESDQAVLDGLAHRLVTGALKVQSVDLPLAPVPAGSLLPVQEAPPPVEPKPPKKTTFVEIVLMDDGDPPKPVAGARYRIETPEGNVIEGTLDGSGKARVDGIDPGDCKVTFPDLHREDVS
jgi:hypothetical protein